MNQSELYALLKTTDYPVAYHQFEGRQTPPFIVYIFREITNFPADNRAYFKIFSYDIELYTLKKDLTAEGKIEGVLDEAGVYWEKSETYIESEKAYQILYQINV